MNRFPVGAATVAVVALFCCAVAQGADKGQVSAEMSARKVVRDSKGSERFESADRAKPGEVIEYVAVYRNTGKGKVTDLFGTIPVPQGMEYIPGSAAPSPFQASLDGKGFAPAPLKRRVRMPDGREELREVPPGEYRALRWDLKSLEAGKSAKVAARMRISNTPPEAK